MKSRQLLHSGLCAVPRCRQGADAPPVLRGDHVIIAAALAIVIVLAIALLTPMRGSGNARITATRAQLASLTFAVELFHSENGLYPGALEDLIQKPRRQRTGTVLISRRIFPATLGTGSTFTNTRAITPAGDFLTTSTHWDLRRTQTLSQSGMTPITSKCGSGLVALRPGVELPYNLVCHHFPRDQPVPQFTAGGERRQVTGQRPL